MCICDISVEDVYTRLPLSASVAWVLENRAIKSMGWRRFLVVKKERRSRWKLEPPKNAYQVRFSPQKAPELWWFSADDALRKRL
ncbi:hypothetical protein [Budvicia diplopodorum]|uniref:hypothetical protein n=1 Tax=Budvicia diplopodorum TaxID=1119056 RepID=UPI0013587C89|nr:hypothetical protein [Budvicia diplopodorum]